MECTPSHAQAIDLRSRSEKEELTAGLILSIMEQEKPNQVEQFRIPKERIAKFFAPGTPTQTMEDAIMKHKSPQTVSSIAFWGQTAA